MELTLTKVEPFLPELTQAQTTRAEAWLTAIEVLLNTRYGARITTENEPLFLNYAGDAVLRRFQRDNKTIAQQNVGPAGVRYTEKSALGAWFWPEEISSMDSTAGRGGVQTVRMSAPDSVRFSNRSTPWRYLEEGDFE